MGSSKAVPTPLFRFSQEADCFVKVRLAEGRVWSVE